MTIYKCNHCDQEIKKNGFPHEAGYFSIKVNEKIGHKMYCSECIYGIALWFVNGASL